MASNLACYSRLAVNLFNAKMSLRAMLQYHLCNYFLLVSLLIIAQIFPYFYLAC